MITDISYTKPNGDIVPMKLYQFVDIEGMVNTNCHRFHFIDVNAKELTFTNVDFSSCHFQRVYFYKAKFIGCNFTGARFSKCNFRGADFYNCTFDFTDFDKTIILPKQVIPSAPHQSGIRKELMQSLRANAISIGDQRAVGTFILEEIDAAKIHCLKVWQAKEGYYAQKYTRITDRLKHLVKYWGWQLDDFVWGHGEKPKNSVVFAVFIIAICSVLKAYFDYQAGGVHEVPLLLAALKDNFIHYGLSLIGVDSGIKSYLSLEAIIAATRFVLFGLVVSLLFRTLSHR